MTHFSKTLSGLISSRKRKVPALAKYSGLDASYIHRLWTGEKRNPSLRTIRRLTDAFFVDEAEWASTKGWIEPRIDRECPEYTSALARLLIAATKDAVA